MKALLFIALLCSVFLSTGLSAQESKVDIDFTDTPLPNILQEIKRQSDIKLAYDARNLRSIIMSVQLSDVDVKSAFDSLLIELPYEAVFIKSTWLIIPSENYVKSQSSEPKRDFKVSGRLINSQNGQALPYANVSLQGSLGGAVSNLDGYFSIPNVRSDSIPLCFSYVGFRTRCIDLREHETENMIVQLEPTNTYLLAVEVIAEQESDD
ncbi:MAG: carboxypeptidase-like regulatory domain-containing protein, partial [Flavobacteriales bacterium]|nr:carboxypeptidase-like regulatory domain-containing protein [Flavobacteriales bacterium]